MADSADTWTQRTPAPGRSVYPRPSGRLIPSADVFLKDNLALNLAFRWQNADADGDGNLTVEPDVRHRGPHVQVLRTARGPGQATSGLARRSVSRRPGARRVSLSNLKSEVMMKTKGTYMATAAVLLAVAPAIAQQAAAPPGSPAATTTLDGKQLPPPDPTFGGVIKEKASESKPGGRHASCRRRAHPTCCSS